MPSVPPCRRARLMLAAKGSRLSVRRQVWLEPAGGGVRLFFLRL